MWTCRMDFCPNVLLMFKHKNLSELASVKYADVFWERVSQTESFT
jgi:hypothetical protein